MDSTSIRRGTVAWETFRRISDVLKAPISAYVLRATRRGLPAWDLFAFQTSALARRIVCFQECFVGTRDWVDWRRTLVVGALPTEALATWPDYCASSWALGLVVFLSLLRNDMHRESSGWGGSGIWWLAPSTSTRSHNVTPQGKHIASQVGRKLTATCEETLCTC